MTNYEVAIRWTLLQPTQSPHKKIFAAGDVVYSYWPEFPLGLWLDHPQHGDRNAICVLNIDAYKYTTTTSRHMRTVEDALIESRRNDAFRVPLKILRLPIPSNTHKRRIQGEPALDLRVSSALLQAALARVRHLCLDTHPRRPSSALRNLREFYQILYGLGVLKSTYPEFALMANGPDISHTITEVRNYLFGEQIVNAVLRLLGHASYGLGMWRKFGWLYMFLRDPRNRRLKSTELPEYGSSTAPWLLGALGTAVMGDGISHQIAARNEQLTEQSVNLSDVIIAERDREPAAGTFASILQEMIYGQGTTQGE